ncbi:MULTISPECIES: hypothetical protein [unclassified Brachybacterium]|uniref:hypothetical protein n=1 Tax=unclassified Brachybacterium TaxID=2623841 RepID=UPI0040341C55
MSVQTPLDRPPTTTTALTPLSTLRAPLPEHRRALQASPERAPSEPGIAASVVPSVDVRAARVRRRAIERARRREAAEQALQERDQLFLNALATTAMPRR